MKFSHARLCAFATCLMGLLLLNPHRSSAQTFAATGSMTTARASYSATLLQNGSVLVAGGSNGSPSVENFLSTAELYNPATGTFTATGSLAHARSGHTATLLQNGMVLIAGGRQLTNFGATIASAELYNPSTGTFTATGSMIDTRYDHTATLLPNGMVLITGGYYFCGRTCGNVLSEAELYNPSTGTFTATGSMQYTRRLHTATLLNDGKVLVAGGCSGANGAESHAELYDPSKGTFTATGNMNSPRCELGAAMLGDGRVLISGGTTNTTTLSSAEIYDPSTGTFSATGSMTTPRTYPTATVLQYGMVLITGGYGSNSLSSAEIYDPSTATFAATGSMSTGRYADRATLLNNGTVLIAGGESKYGTYLSSAEVYDSGVVMGFVNPKFVIVGVTYAPPGPSSNVTYTNSTFVGNTTTTTGSFSNDNNLTISVTNGIGAWMPMNTGFGVKITGTDSNDYTQSSNTSGTVTISKQTSVSDKTNGTGNAFSPVNHDYDTIWLWLNPLMVYGINRNKPSFLQWTGYGYDNNDVNGMDIYGVQVGCLNGDFGSCPSVATILQRNWVTTNEPGMTWPTGEGPGLTSADKANVLLADPFANSSYVLPSPLPSTSADGRFTQIAYPPNPVNYSQAGPGNGGGTTTMYNAVYTNTSSVGKGASYSYKQAFGTEALFKGGVWLVNWQIDVKQTDTLTWTNTWENTLTTTTTLTDAFSITGPGCPQTSPPCVPAYTGPGEFLVYQDNLYGTFMFYPGN